MHHWQLSGICGSLLENFDDGLAIFQLYGHEDPRHERKMKGHVEFVAVAEIGRHVRGPLVRFGQKHLAGILAVQRACADRE